MKSHRPVAVVAVIVGLVFLLATPAAPASVLYWQTSGSGYWDTDNDWGTAANGTGTLSWANSDDAYFYQTSTGTVSIYGSPIVANVTFNAAGYVVTGGSLNVTGTITANYNATINSVLGGSNGLTTSGNATLTLGGANAYTGLTSVRAGTLQLGASPSALTPLVHYTFDGTLGTSVPTTSGAIVNVGSLGTAVNATMTGAGATYVAGRFAQGMSNGGQYAVSSSNAGFDGLNAWTDSIWINVSAQPGGWNIVNGRNTDGGGGGFYESYDGTKFATGIQNSSGGWINEQGQLITYTLPLNTWHMVTFAVSSAGWYFYIDGGLSGSASGTMAGTPEFSPGNNGLFIGGRPGHGGTGSLDDFQLYGSVLTAAQINAIYLSGATAYGALPTTSPVQVASGATLDLGGISQTVGGLSDLSGSGGTVTTSQVAQPTLTLAPTAGSSPTFSGVIQDGAGQTSLTLNGPAVQVLAGSNTYSGLTTITAGTLQIGAGGTTGSIGGTSAIADNGVLAFDHSDTVTVAVPVTGAGGLNQMGGGTLILSSSKNAYSGPTLVSAGTLQAGYLFDRQRRATGQRGRLGHGRLQSDDPLAVRREQQRRHGDEQRQLRGVGSHPVAECRLDHVQRRDQ